MMRCCGVAPELVEGPGFHFYRARRGAVSVGQSKPCDLAFPASFEDWPEAERKRHLLRLWRAEEHRRPLMLELVLEVLRGITVEGVELTVPLEP